jgi:hypothetical protein
VSGRNPHFLPLAVEGVERVGDIASKISGNFAGRKEFEWTGNNLGVAGNMLCYRNASYLFVGALIGARIPYYEWTVGGTILSPGWVNVNLPCLKKFRVVLLA